MKVISRLHSDFFNHATTAQNFVVKVTPLSALQ
jgi:hypothetical protein